MRKKEEKNISRNVRLTFSNDGISLVECMKNIIINKKMLDKS